MVPQLSSPALTVWGTSLAWNPLLEGELVSRLIDVVGAVIIRDERVLCVQRGPDGTLPGMWEFPGGKIESGETPREALQREITEELLCSVSVGDQLEVTSYEYDFGTVKLTTFLCELVEGEPKLTEHAAQAWLTASELESLDWAPADIPAVKRLVERLT